VVLHRQQRQRGDAERLEVRDRHRMRERAVAAAQFLGNLRMRHGETPDVHSYSSTSWSGVARPVAVARRLHRRRRDARLQRLRGVVARVGRAIALGIAQHVAVVDRFVPVLTNDLAGARDRAAACAD
jgi:hypothetical protein